MHEQQILTSYIFYLLEGGKGEAARAYMKFPCSSVRQRFLHRHAGPVYKSVQI